MGRRFVIVPFVLWSASAGTVLAHAGHGAGRDGVEHFFSDPFHAATLLAAAAAAVWGVRALAARRARGRAR